MADKVTEVDSLEFSYFAAQKIEKFLIERKEKKDAEENQKGELGAREESRSFDL